MQQMNFYCRSYCLLNMFRTPLCPSSKAREYYKSGCCLSYLMLGFQVVGMVWSCGSPNTTGSNHLYNTLELLMIGIMVTETCWASNKIYNKNSSVASSWHFISTYYRWCTVKTTSKPHQNVVYTVMIWYVLHASVNYTIIVYTTVFLKMKSQFRNM